MTSHPSPGVKPPDSGRAVQKNQGISETHSSTYAPGLSTLSSLSRIVAQLAPSSLCYPSPLSHHPSNRNSVYPAPALQLLKPPTLFQSLGTLPFSPRVLTISLLSYRLYSPSPFLLATKLLKHIISRTFIFFHQHFS